MSDFTKDCSSCRYSELTEIGKYIECSGCTLDIQTWIDCRKNNYKHWEKKEIPCDTCIEIECDTCPLWDKYHGGDSK